MFFGVTGGLGRQVVKTLRDLPLEILHKDRSNFSMDLSVEEVISEIEQTDARAMINCVAMTGLAACHADRNSALSINGLFSQTLSAAAFLTGCKYFNFSTEFVFPCDQEGKKYAESDTARPLTDYGLTKYLGEPKGGLRNTYTIRLPLLYGPTHENQIVGRLLNIIQDGGTAWAAGDVYSTPVCSIDVANFIGDAVCGNIDLPQTIHLYSENTLSLYQTLRVIVDSGQFAGELIYANSTDFTGNVFKPPFGGLKSEYAAALPSVEANAASILF